MDIIAVLYSTALLCKLALLDNNPLKLYNKHTLHRKGDNYANRIHYIMGVNLSLLLLYCAQDGPCIIYIGRFFPVYVRMVSRKLSCAV